MRSMPRAPIEAKGCTSSACSGAKPRATRSRFRAATRSGALSASVPSKSKSTARLGVTHAAQEVVDVAVAAQPVALRERVVGQADELAGPQRRLARGARQLGG